MFNKWVPTEKIFFHPKAIIGLPQNLFLGVRRHENYSHRGKLALKWGKIVWTARISVQMFSTIITGLKQTPSNAKKMLLNPFLEMRLLHCITVCVLSILEYAEFDMQLSTEKDWIHKTAQRWFLCFLPLLFFGKNSF